MMTHKTESPWTAHLSKQWSENLELVELDPFEGWDQDDMPEMMIEDYLGDGLAVLYSGLSDDVASRLLASSIQLFERAQTEDKFESESCKYNFPLNLAIGLRASFYARALRGDQYHLADLEPSAEYFEEWCRTYSPGDWNSVSEAYLLDAVRLRLILGERTRAHQLLELRRIKWHEEERDILLRLATSADLNDTALEQLDLYFDPMRSPRYQSSVYLELDVVRLEVSILRYKFFRSHDDTIDWAEVIRQVAK